MGSPPVSLCPDALLYALSMKIPHGVPRGCGVPKIYCPHRNRRSRARYRNVKLCFVRLAERPNRHADNDPVDSLGLAGVTRDSYSLVEMKTAAVASNLAFVEYDLASSMLTTIRSSLLRNLCPRCSTFLVNRIRSPIESGILSRSNTLIFVRGQVATASRRRPFRR
jgi:hypothetical protein